MAKNEENRTLYPQGLKRCSKCREIKALIEFSKKSSTWDGLRSTCKACDKLDHDRYRSIPENRQRENQDSRKYKEQNRQSISDYNKKYRQEKPILVQAARRDWHLRHKESENAISRKRMSQWAKENRERHRANGRNRHAREMGAEGSHTWEQWIHLLTFFKGRCPCCGKKRKLTLDHIVPLKWGGTHFINNIQALCKPCNCAKGDRHATDYRPEAARLWAESEMAKMTCIPQLEDV